MTLSTIQTVSLLVGDSAADRPTTPTPDAIFFDKALSQVSVFADTAWQGTNPVVASVATMTALKAIAATSRYEPMIVMVLADQSLWYFHATSALTGDDILVATPAAGSGRWLRLPGAVDLVMPVTFATADAAVLLTFPTGSRFQYDNAFISVTTQFAGGTDSSIGISSNKTGYSTKGDLIGATLTAALTAGVRPGTIGTGVDSLAERHAAIFIPTDTIRWDRIVDAFTSGVGSVHVTGQLLNNAGA